jgi:hypothetical protein
VGSPSGRDPRRVAGRLTILVALRLRRQPAQSAFRQIISGAWQAVARRADSPLDASRAIPLCLLLFHRCPRGGWRATRPKASGPSRSALTALPAGFGGALAILGEVARIVLCTAAAVAVLAALAPGLGRALAVIGEIAGTVLPTDVTGARRLLTVFGEIAWVPGMPLFGHSKYSSLDCSDGLARLAFNGAGRLRLSSRFP